MNMNSEKCVQERQNTTIEKRKQRGRCGQRPSSSRNYGEDGQFIDTADLERSSWKEEKWEDETGRKRPLQKSKRRQSPGKKGL